MGAAASSGMHVLAGPIGGGTRAAGLAGHFRALAARQAGSAAGAEAAVSRGAAGGHYVGWIAVIVPRGPFIGTPAKCIYARRLIKATPPGDCDLRHVGGQPGRGAQAGRDDRAGHRWCEPHIALGFLLAFYWTNIPSGFDFIRLYIRADLVGHLWYDRVDATAAGSGGGGRDGADGSVLAPAFASGAAARGHQAAEARWFSGPSTLLSTCACAAQARTWHRHKRIHRHRHRHARKRAEVAVAAGRCTTKRLARRSGTPSPTAATVSRCE